MGNPRKRESSPYDVRATTPPATDPVRAHFLIVLSYNRAPPQAPLPGHGIEIGPAFDVTLSVRINRKVAGLQLVIAVAGHAFLLKVVDFLLIRFCLLQYPSMQLFLACRACVGLIDPPAVPRRIKISMPPMN